MKIIIASARGFFTAAALSGVQFASTALAQTTDDVTAACSAGTNLPAPVCDCMGERSAEFSDRQREFMAAALLGDSDLANQLRAGIPVADLVAATNFIASAPQECLQGG